MATNDPRALLSRVQGVRHACDLDLLLFFQRHPRALLTSEQLVNFVGHGRERVAMSLDGLIEAGHLTRLQNPSRAARLYVLEVGGARNGSLIRLLKLAGTRGGRREVMQLLEGGPERAPTALQRRSARVTPLHVKAKAA